MSMSAKRTWSASSASEAAPIFVDLTDAQERIEGAHKKAKTDAFSELAEAVDAGQISTLRRLLRQGYSPKITPSGEQSLLTRAARRGDLKIVVALLNAGVEPHEGSYFGSQGPDSQSSASNPSDSAARLKVCTKEECCGDMYCTLERIKKICVFDPDRVTSKIPLMVAAAHGHVDVVKRLLKVKRGCTKKDLNGRDALHYAIAFGHPNCVTAILDAGFEIGCDCHQCPPHLLMAAYHNQLEIMKLLMGRFNYRIDDTLFDLSALVITILQGHFQATKLLVEAGADLHGRSSRFSPLNVSIRMNSETAMNLLFERASYRPSDSETSRAVSLAARHGFATCLRVLLNRGGNINATDSDRRTALHHAAEHGQDVMVQTLLEMKANLDVLDNTRVTPLMLATTKSHLNCIDLLIKSGANIEVRGPLGRTAAMIACTHNQPAALKMLLEKGADGNARDTANYTALMLACANRAVDCARLLLQQSINVDQTHVDDGRSPLSLAVENNDEECVDLLFSYNANPHPCKNMSHSPLFSAIYHGNVNLARKLLENGAPVEARRADGSTPLFFACSRGNKSLIHLLIEYHADVNATDLSDWTPLMLCASNSLKKAARALIQGNADVNHNKNAAKYTALMLACSYDYRDIAADIIAAGADVRARNIHGRTPLMVAVLKYSPGCLNLLLDRLPYPYINDRDTDGATALILAAYVGNDTAVRVLLSRGADFNLTRNDGATAFMVAAERGHTRVVQALMDQMRAKSKVRSILNPSESFFRGSVVSNEVYSSIISRPHEKLPLHHSLYGYDDDVDEEEEEDEENSDFDDDEDDYYDEDDDIFGFF